MADFARVLAALDNVVGTDALPRYLAQRSRIAGDVLDADPAGVALAALLKTRGMWSGTAAELLCAILPEQPGRDWPRNARGMAGRLKRLTPALRAAGYAVEHERAGRSRERRIFIAPSAPGADEPPTVADDCRFGRSSADDVAPIAAIPLGANECAAADDADGADCSFDIPSDDDPRSLEERYAGYEGCPEAESWGDV